MSQIGAIVEYNDLILNQININLEGIHRELIFIYRIFDHCVKTMFEIVSFILLIKKNVQ